MWLVNLLIDQLMTFDYFILYIFINITVSVKIRQENRKKCPKKKIQRVNARTDKIACYHASLLRDSYDCASVKRKEKKIDKRFARITKHRGKGYIFFSFSFAD